MARPATDLKHRLVAAARDAFDRRGVDAVSLRAIAQRAGTTIGMVYYYFPTKDDLFLAVVEEVYAGLLADLEVALTGDTPPRERLRRLYVRIGQVSAEELDTIRLLAREALTSTARLERIIERFQRGHMPLVLRAVGDGLADGSIDPGLHPAVVFFATLGVGLLPQLVARVVGPKLPFAAMPAGEALFDRLDGPAIHRHRTRQRHPMITLRRATDRGHANHGWLDTWHTFSFADYHDARHMGYRTLRVINDDRVAPGRGFGTHPHSDMEIVTYVLAGKLQHRDSMGTGSIIEPGEVQRMTAGTGVTHSELNPSRTEPLHLLQIWIVPEQRRLAPGYEQKRFPDAERRGRLRLVASRDGRDGSVTIHQDAALWAGRFDGGERAVHELAAGRGAWVHVARGQVDVNGQQLGPGDAAAIEGEPVTIAGVDEAEVLLFDLA